MSSADDKRAKKVGVSAPEIIQRDYVIKIRVSEEGVFMKLRAKMECEASYDLFNDSFSLLLFYQFNYPPSYGLNRRVDCTLYFWVTTNL